LSKEIHSKRATEEDKMEWKYSDDPVTIRELFKTRLELAKFDLAKLDPNVTDVFILKRNLSSTTSIDERKRIEYLISLLNRIDELQLSIEVLNRIIGRRAIVTESASSEQDKGAIDNKISEENFEEDAGNPVEVVSMGYSRSFQGGQRGVLDIQEYLARPVKLSSGTFALSTDYFLSLSLWSLFFAVPSVRAKLRNCSFIRGNLHYRFSVSGTPFHYGQFLVSPQPYSPSNVALTNLWSFVTTDKLITANYLSQASGSAIVNVNENMPLEGVWPFICTQPMLRLFNNSSLVLGAGTDYDDMLEMGNLYIMTLNQIKSVSTSPSSLYYQVYAWMEDVEFTPNTGTQIAITTESKSRVKKDERVIGPVERISTALYNFSNWSGISSISPFSKASTMAIGSVAQISALFGWSKPIMNTVPNYIRNEAFPNGATTIGFDMSHKIATDPQNELNVDSSLCGDSEDGMVLRNISSRMSFYNTYTWGHLNGPLATNIFCIPVTPNLVTLYSPTLTVAQPTACAFAVQPFMYWRGTVKFRINICCSAFHRGKYAIYFEPNISQKALINATFSLNKQFIKVIDIQDTQTVEFCIGWANQRPWLVSGSAVDALYINDGTVTSALGFANGYITMVPFTALQSPDNSDVAVNVFVCCEDLQVSCPVASNLPKFRRIFTQSKSSVHSTEITCIYLNESTASTEGICEDYFGEQVVSFRSLLKRFVSSQQIATPVLTSVAFPGTLKNIMPILPVNMAPYSATALTFTDNWDLFSYLRYSYLGIRGSIRVRFKILQSISTVWVKSGLEEPSTTFVSSSSYIAPALTTTWQNPSPLTGSTTFVPGVNSAYPVEFPYYSQNLFQICFSDSYDTSTASTADTMATKWFRNFNFCYDSNTTTAPASSLSIDKAAGEDFNLMRFQGASYYTST